MEEFDSFPWRRKDLEKDSPMKVEDLDPSPSCAFTHLVLVEDTTLGTVSSPNGPIQFLQAVALTDLEYQASRVWRLTRVMSLLPRHPKVGPLMINDLTRTKSLFELVPKLLRLVVLGAKEEGSDLFEIPMTCYWVDKTKRKIGTDRLDINDIQPNFDKKFTELFTHIERVHIHFAPCGGDLMTLMARSRLGRGEALVFRTPECMRKLIKQIVSFTPSMPSERNEYVAELFPLRGSGGFLQIMYMKELVDELINFFQGYEYGREGFAFKYRRVSYMAKCLFLSLTIHPSLDHFYEQLSEDLLAERGEDRKARMEEATEDYLDECLCQ